MKKLLLLLLVAIVVVGGCATPSGLKRFASLCQEHGHQWMHMRPMSDGQFTSEEVCWGCMPDAKTHLCSEEDYQSSLGSGMMMGKEMKEMHEQMEDMMHGETMVAHAGMKKSIDVHTFTVRFDHPPVVAGTETELSFTITDVSTGTTVKDLEIMHERPMHLILVRDDLNHFDHIHPTLEGEEWAVQYTFTAGGHYRIWIDFMKGMPHLVDFDVMIDGPADAEEPDRLEGLQVEMERDGTRFQFAVKDVRGKHVPLTESFLGAAAHLVTIDAPLEDFGHAHDEDLDGDHLLTFTPTFSTTGPHRGWLQFSYQGKDRTAPFSFSVEERA